MKKYIKLLDNNLKIIMWTWGLVKWLIWYNNNILCRLIEYKKITYFNSSISGYYFLSQLNINFAESVFETLCRKILIESLYSLIRVWSVFFHSWLNECIFPFLVISFWGLIDAILWHQTIMSQSIYKMKFKSNLLISFILHFDQLKR